GNAAAWGMSRHSPDLTYGCSVSLMLPPPVGLCTVGLHCRNWTLFPVHCGAALQELDPLPCALWGCTAGTGPSSLCTVQQKPCSPTNAPGCPGEGPVRHPPNSMYQAAPGKGRERSNVLTFRALPALVFDTGLKHQRNEHITIKCTVRLICLLTEPLTSEPEGFSHFHLYVCAAFLVRWRKEILEEKDFQELLLFLQNLPTAHWDDEDISLLLAEAYRLKFAFADAPNHYKK
ncbi:hypothetical protein H8959_007219, partial [Pygathrix nigripes]